MNIFKKLFGGQKTTEEVKKALIERRLLDEVHADDAASKEQ